MSRRTMPYHRRYHGDALQGYRRLTLEQRGAYTTILDLIYDACGPIDFNERWIAGELNCSIRKARALISELLDLQKIYITTRGQISNHRCEAEIENSVKISQKARESVMKREEKRTESRDFVNKINGSKQRSINDRSSIPVPVPDRIKPTERLSSGVEEDRPDPADGPSEPDHNHIGRHDDTVVPIENHQRLLAALDRGSIGRGALSVAIAASQKRRH
ncbi:unknown [Sinorhizobium phage PBC5]|uniref:DUF1376 domain-containing protein n=1 Tax=Sinorhizobium phage PBC5 TaxID=179237 RepID=UPI000009B431|nr:DUF1376 domain-containing protein [Sinorhizobium phage PBC5]AAL49593.1 unknown [Sinorhizobium phage PBC5]